MREAQKGTADSINTTETGSNKSWTEVVRRGKRGAPNSGTRPQTRVTRTDPHHRDSLKPRAKWWVPAQTVPVPDAMRIWGTLKTATTRAVEKAIASLTKVSISEIKLKRKYKTATDNSNSSTTSCRKVVVCR